MRVVHQLVVQVGRDTNFNQKLFYIEPTNATVTADNFSEQASGTFELQAGTSQTLSLQDISDARGLYLEADQDVTVTINGTGVYEMRRSSNASVASCKLFVEAIITSVMVEAPSAASARGCFCLWGDPTAT